MARTLTGERLEWRDPEGGPRTRRDVWRDATGQNRPQRVLEAEATQFSRDLAGSYNKAALAASLMAPPVISGALMTAATAATPVDERGGVEDVALMAVLGTMSPRAVGRFEGLPAESRAVTSTAVGPSRVRVSYHEGPKLGSTAVAPVRSRTTSRAPSSSSEVIDLNPRLSTGIVDSTGRFHSFGEIHADAMRAASEAATRQANAEFLASAQERATRLQIHGDRQMMAQARGGTHDPKFARVHSGSTLVVPEKGGPAMEATEFSPAPVQGRVSHWVDLFRKGRQAKSITKTEASVKTAREQLAKFDEGVTKLAAEGKIDATSAAVMTNRQAFRDRVASALIKQRRAEGKLQATEQRIADYARGSTAKTGAVGQAVRAARSPWEYGFGKWDPQLVPGSWKVKTAVGTGLFTAGASMYGTYRAVRGQADTAEAVLQDQQAAGDLFNQIEAQYLNDPVNARAVLSNDDLFRQFHEAVATAAAATYKANHENDPVVRQSLRESIDRRRAAIDARLRGVAPALYRDRIEYLRDSRTTLPGPEAWYDQTDAQADAVRGGR